MTVAILILASLVLLFPSWNLNANAIADGVLPKSTILPSSFKRSVVVLFNDVASSYMCNRELGLVKPIPMLPAKSTVILSKLFVLSLKSCALKLPVELKSPSIPTLVWYSTVVPLLPWSAYLLSRTPPVLFLYVDVKVPSLWTEIKSLAPWPICSWSAFSVPVTNNPHDCVFAFSEP